ncbi:MAG: hypothetical protein AAGA25_14230, partial [Planctomycetota bacterium]
MPCSFSLRVFRSVVALSVGLLSWWGVSAHASISDPRPTEGSSGALATIYGYNDAGYQHRVTDNAGMVTQTEYDALGRPRKVIENYIDGSPETGDADEDRTTAYEYNAAGQITQQTADLNDSTSGGDQVTHYIY